MLPPLTKLILGIAAACLLPASAWGAQIDLRGDREIRFSDEIDTNKISPIEPDARKWEQAELLLEKLGSPFFAERQAAIEELWRLGPEITNSLETALNDPDPEVVKRVRLVLDAFELGLDASTPRATALTVLYFENGDSDVREQIIRNLENQFEFGMIFDLLSRVKDPTERKALYTEEIALDSTIYRLACREKWDVIDEILNHEIPWDFDFQLCIYYAQLNGTLDEKIAALKGSIDRDAETLATRPVNQEQADDENNPAETPLNREELARQNFQSDLLLLIRMLRITGRRQEAIEYATKLSNASLRNQFTDCMLMELGNWAAIESRLDAPEGKARTALDQIPTSPAQRALVHHFAGSTEAFESVIASMIANANQDSTPIAEQSFRADLLDVFLVTTDWDRAANYVDHENRLEMFQLYSTLQRNEQAFESLGISDDANQRIIWFERLAKQLNSVFRQYERASSENSVSRQINQRIGVPNVEQDSFLRKADSIFQLGLFVAQQVGSLGFTDEAVLHLLTLADAIDMTAPGSQEKRLQILEILVDLSEFEQAWQLVEKRFSKSEYPILLRSLFPNKSAPAEYWWNFVAPLYPDRLDQVKAVASILNSPLQTADIQVNLDTVLAMVDGSLASTNRNTRQLTLYQIAMVHFFHGNFQLSHQHMLRAAEERNYLAETFLADAAFETEDFEQAATIFDRLWKRTVSSESNTYSAAAAAVCYERLGDYEKAKQRRLVAFASWLDSYRTENIIRQFESRNCLDRMLPMLKASVYASPAASVSNEFYRLSLANTQTDLEPAEAVANWRIYLFNRLATSSMTGKPYVANMAAQLKRAEAMTLLEAGDAEGAEAALEQYNHFRPGDPEIAEKLIPAFDETGHTDLASALFEQIAQYYAQTLGRYPDSPLHHNNYAWVCATSKRRLQFAKFHADLAVKARPGNSSYLDTLAEILFLEGKTQSALEVCQQCLQIQPSKRHYQMQFLRFGGKLD